MSAPEYSVVRRGEREQRADDRARRLRDRDPERARREFAHALTKSMFESARKRK